MIVVADNIQVEVQNHMYATDHTVVVAAAAAATTCQELADSLYYIHLGYLMGIAGSDNCSYKAVLADIAAVAAVVHIDIVVDEMVDSLMYEVVLAVVDTVAASPDDIVAVASDIDTAVPVLAELVVVETIAVAVENNIVDVRQDHHSLLQQC
mmetsp:Transcript_3541/g.5126  ORF Transcript_3541/g.5126 Transcript_3541/m.5126 type:complete len:152 (-) Transcript_3541:786-1241(-)